MGGLQHLKLSRMAMVNREHRYGYKTLNLAAVIVIISSLLVKEMNLDSYRANEPLQKEAINSNWTLTHSSSK